MHEFANVDIELNVLDANRRLADANRALMDGHGIRAVDFMGSIGSGKTLIIERMLEMLKKNGRSPAVIAGDVAGDDDYRRFIAHGVPAVNLNTGKDCHLNAHLAQHALEDLDLDGLDYVIFENVGNLVCPADFPLGAHRRVVVISVTEGDDMVRKHPMIFTAADVIVINKVDLAPIIEVDPAILVADAVRLVPHTPTILTDAKHGIGIAELIAELGMK